MIKLIDAYTPTSMPAGWLGMALIHKATEGTSNRQTAYGTRMAQHRAAGLAARGSYHAFRGNVDAVAQANWYLDYAKPLPGDIMALDLEEFAGSWAGKSRATIAGMAKAFMARCHVRYPKNRLILYCNRSDYNGIVKAYGVPVYDGLWLATLDGARPTNYPWLICQYAVIGNVDWNDAKFATQKAMAAWAGGKTVDKAPIEGESGMGATTLSDGRPLFAAIGTNHRLCASTDPLAAASPYRYVGGSTWLPGCDVATWGAGAVFLVRDEDRQIYVITVPDMAGDLSKAAPQLLPNRNADGTPNTKVKATADGGLSVTPVGDRFECLAKGTDADSTLYAGSFTLNANGGVAGSSGWKATDGAAG
jgi:uncharacterized Zn-binding protein involved in type VI secretion